MRQDYCLFMQDREISHEKKELKTLLFWKFAPTDLILSLDNIKSFEELDAFKIKNLKLITKTNKLINFLYKFNKKCYIDTFNEWFVE